MRKRQLLLLLVCAHIYLLSAILTKNSYAQDKPIWHFSILARINDTTVTHLGGMEIVRNLIHEQMDSINHKYNSAGCFDGIFDFSVDSICTYRGHPFPAARLPHPEHDYQIIYDCFYFFGGNWIYPPQNTLILCLSTTADDKGPFGSLGNLIASHELAHSRGAADIYGTRVSGSENIYNGEGFSPDTSIMNTNSWTKWDNYSIHIINKHEDRILEPGDFDLTGYFPDLVELSLRDLDGNPVEGANIKAYPHTWYDYELDTIPVFWKFTNPDGLCPIRKMPFLPAHGDTCHNILCINYSTLLFEAEYNGNFGYEWLTFFDVQNTYFDNPGEPHRFEITLPFRLYDTTQVLPQKYTLYQNYPNPFNPETIIPIRIFEKSEVTLEIINSLGRVEETIFNGQLDVGEHRFRWDGKNYPSGIYLYRLTSGDAKMSKKMVLLK